MVIEHMVNVITELGLASGKDNDAVTNSFQISKQMRGHNNRQLAVRICYRLRK